MSGRFLRATVVAASFVSSAIAQNFIKPAPGSFPSYVAGQQVQIQWSSPWEQTQLQLYQGPNPQWVYTALLNNVSQSTTSYTWAAAPLQGNSLDGQYFYFQIMDYSNLGGQGVSTNEFQLAKAVSISVSQPSSTMATSSSAASSSTATAATTTAAAAASTTGTASSMGKAPYSSTSSTAAAAATSEAASGSGSSSSASSASTTSTYPNYTSSYLGVGLGLGIPVVLAATLGAFFFIRNKRKMSRESIALEKGRGAA